MRFEELLAEKAQIVERITDGFNIGPVYHRGSFNPDHDKVFEVGDQGVHFGTRDAADSRPIGAMVDGQISDLEVSQEDNGRWYWSSGGLDSWDLDEDGFATEAAAREAGEQDATNAADNYEWEDNDSPLTEAYLRITNPATFRDQAGDWAPAIAEAKSKGHDGIAYRNEFEDAGSKSYLVFSPDQVKVTRRVTESQLVTEAKNKQSVNLTKIFDPKRKKRSKNVKIKSLQKFTPTTTPHDKPLPKGWKRWEYECESAERIEGREHQGYVAMDKENSVKDVYCSCFSGEALVLMADGFYKPIREVEEGDMVYTHRGVKRKVVTKHQRAVESGETVHRVKVRGFVDDLIATGEHPFYVLRGNDQCLCGCGGSVHTDWKLQSETFTPKVVMEKRWKRGHHMRDAVLPDRTPHFKWVNVEDFRPKEWALSPWLSRGDVSVDPDYARLIGYYAAEGSCQETGQQIKLTFNFEEMDTLVSDVVRICNKLHFQQRVQPCGRSGIHSENPTWVDVFITNRELKDFCVENVGRGSRNKKLSKTIMDWDFEGLYNLALGMHAGDGSVCSDANSPYVSGSFDLASQFAIVLAKLGLEASVAWHRKKTRMYQSNPNSPTCGAFVGDLRKLQGVEKPVDLKREYRAERFDEGCIRTVQIEDCDYSGKVYNLEVEGDNSYIVNSVAVHNCGDFQFRWRYALSHDQEKPMASEIVPDEYQDIETKAPYSGTPSDITNPDYKKRLCKHLLKVLDSVKT